MTSLENNKLIEEKIVQEMNMINNYAITYAATRMQKLLIKAYDEIINDFYTSYTPKKYVRHSENFYGTKINNPANMGENLYRAADPISRHLGRGGGSQIGGVRLTSKDLRDFKYRVSKERVLSYVLDGIRFPATPERAAMTFVAKYDGIVGTPLYVLSQLSEKYSETFLQKGYEEANKNVKTKYVKYV